MGDESEKCLTYKEAGVDVDLGDICSRLMTKASRNTFANRQGKIGEIEVLEEEGLHRIITMNFSPYKLMMNSDGIGTKIEIAERVGNHRTMAFDLIAMLADDSVRYGAEPVAATNLIDVNQLNRYIIEQCAEGLVEACRKAGIANVAGEIAELSSRVDGYREFNYNWGGTVLSILDPEKVITGERIRIGDMVIALRQDGPGTNGISLVRKVAQRSYGDDWHSQEIEGLEKPLGQAVLTPCTIYTPVVLDLIGRFGEEPKVEVHGVVHVTGGGIPTKFGRVLKAVRLGAELYNLYEPCNLLKHIQKIGNIKDEEAYKTWHMGQRMLVIVPKDQVDTTQAILEHRGIESKVAGNILPAMGLRIHSRGVQKYGRPLPF